MFNRTATLAIGALAGLATAGLAAGAGEAGSGNAIARCEIQATVSGAMTTLEGVVHADAAISGSYRFRVASEGRSGNSNVQQGGAFSAAANDTVTLGRIMLTGSRAIHEASLTVDANGTTISCEERVGGAI